MQIDPSSSPFFTPLNKDHELHQVYDLLKLKKAYLKTLEEIKKDEKLDLSSYQKKENSSNDLKNKALHYLTTQYQKEGSSFQKRIFDEIFEFGPLEALIANETINEIFINNQNGIWYEKNHQNFNFKDEFLSSLSFRNIIQRILESAKISIDLNFPFSNGRWKNFRLHVISAPLTTNRFSLSLRRHKNFPWTFPLLEKTNMLKKEDSKKLLEIIKNKNNFIIAGSTGSGKTSLLNACLQHIHQNERVLTIEDVDEITLPNSISVKLITRKDPHGLLKNYSASDLVFESLRMKPDRLIVGEIRGQEAKDLLIALSTGHRGSISTLHAENPHQALLRLEMLTQMGAPQWNSPSIRKMIQLSLEYIVILKTKPVKENVTLPFERSQKNETSQINQNNQNNQGHQNKRYLSGIYRITSLEETGFLIEKVKSSD